MNEIKFDEDIVRACLQAILSRKVSLGEAKSFIESDEARGYFMDYDDMMTCVWEHYHCEYALIDFVPLETLVFRECVMCITPKEKIKDCYWLDIVNMQVDKEEIGEILDNGIGKGVSLNE